MYLKNLIKKFIPDFLLSWYHFLLVFLGALFYQFPSRLRRGFGGQTKKLKIIGITGTNGKTTTTEMISKILEEARYKVALLNSIRFKIGDKEWLNTLKMTMPGRLKLQRFLRQAVASGCQYVVLEVTSEGIKQHRHRFIDFDIAVFTNLAPEHIEAHGSFENYRATKGKLFQATKGIHVVNLDDENAEYFLKFPANKKIGYTLQNQKLEKIPLLHSSRISADFEKVVGKDIKSISGGLSFKIDDLEFNLNLLGEFNIYNSLAAICVGLSQRISLEVCQKAVEKIEGIPGRMEKVISQLFQVFVDYAFTPNALEKVYQTLQKTKNKEQRTKMICVLGACGGGRDKWKRPVLGEIASKYCDEIIVTNEDPYDEDPNQILSQIKSGITKSQFSISNFYEILDRREAIRKSLELAKAGDIVVITGKGCEPWICLAGGKKISWDDRQVVHEEFNNLGQ